MNELPKDIIILIGTKLKLHDILNLSKTSKKFKKCLWDNDIMWMKLTCRDYSMLGHNQKITGISWRQYYNTFKRCNNQYIDRLKMRLGCGGFYTMSEYRSYLKNTSQNTELEIMKMDIR